MSWQAYVDDNLVASGHLDKAAIYSVKGDSLWASTAGFTASPSELQEVISGLNGSTDKLYQEGLHVGGERYVLTTAEPSRSLYARKGREGIVIVKTTQAILIGHYNETMVAGNSAATAEKLADYLIGLGY